MDEREDTRYERALRYLNRKVAKADRTFGLIGEGDHVLAAVSGGKDSMVMLEMLARRRAWREERYRLSACFVESGLCPPGCDHAAILTAHCAKLEVPLSVVRSEPTDNPEATDDPEPVGAADPEAMGKARELETLGSEGRTSPCFLCSWRRRKALFLTAAQLGCNVVALGHHKDDLAQTLLLNLLWQGRHETMQPRRPMFGGRLTIVRPLALVPEAEIARAARLGALPLHTCPCPHAASSKRQVAAELIFAARKAGCRHAVDNLVASTLSRPDRRTGGRAE
jgi:tRNA 2-thiocytidine biosynthesis protein TtcA